MTTPNTTATVTDSQAPNVQPIPEDFKPTNNDIADIDAALDVAEKKSAEKTQGSTNQIDSNPEVKISASREKSVSTSSSKDSQSQPVTTKSKALSGKKESVPATSDASKASDTAASSQSASSDPSPAASTPAQEPDQEIDSIQKPKGLSPTNDGNWEALRSVARKHKTELVNVQREVAQLRSQVGKVPESFQKQFDELVAFRRVFDIQNDPEFKTKYDSIIISNESQMYDILKECGLPDESVKEVKDAGGIGAVPMKWWKDNVLEKLRESNDPNDNAAGEILEAKLKQNINLSYEKQREIANASKSQSEYLKKKDEAFKTRHQEDIKIMSAEVSEVEKKFPFLKIQEIPKDATPEQRSQIEEENKMYEATTKRFAIALSPPDARAKVQTAIAACSAFYLQRDLEKAYQENDYLKKENGKLKSSGQTSRGGAAAPSSQSKTSKSLSDMIGMKNDEAIEEGLKAIGA